MSVPPTLGLHDDYGASEEMRWSSSYGTGFGLEGYCDVISPFPPPRFVLVCSVTVPCSTTRVTQLTLHV